MKNFKQQLVSKLLFGLLLLSSILIQHNSFTQTIISGGNVYGTWSISGSPYLIEGHLFVPTDSILIIEPGVQVLFQDHYKLNIQGRLIAIGNTIDSIYFGVSDSLISTGWWGLRFELISANPDSSILDYCIIKYGNASGTGENTYGGGIFVKNYPKLRISNSLISNNKSAKGGGIYCDNSSILFLNNTLINNASTYFPGYGGGIYSQLSALQIKNNMISNNNAGIFNSSGGGGGLCTASGNPIISNNTISNNIARVIGGGGILCLNSASPNISNNIISDNTSQGSGGGIKFLSNSSSSVTNNTITNNTALSGGSAVGGGIYASSSTIQVNGNLISNNNSYQGGGIYLQMSNSAAVINNTFSYNTAGAGGAIYCTSSNSLLKSNFITNNQSSDGGGISCISSAPKIINNMICNNEASNNGGGIYCSPNSSPIINNCTISNNKVTSISGVLYGGGGLYCKTNSNPIVKNSIIYGNEAVSTYGNEIYLDDNASDPSFSNCNIQGGVSAFYTNGNLYIGSYLNNIDNNPMYILPSAGNGITFNGLSANWEFQNNSPCIEAGLPSVSGLYLPSTDLAGNNRVINNVIDIGAYEYDSCPQIAIDTSITQNGNTLSSNANNAVYQWLDCDNNYTSISGANSQNYTATSNGNYAVIIFELGCSDTSICTNITTVGIAKNYLNNNDIQFYPNPTSHQLTIVSDKLTISQVNIMDITGKIIKTIKQNTNAINVADLPSGIYFIKLITDERTITKKFVKQ